MEENRSDRIPGLRCEKCGSDKFELEVNSDGNVWTVYLSCAKCSRVFSICHADTYNCISPIVRTTDERTSKNDERTSYE